MRASGVNPKHSSCTVRQLLLETLAHEERRRDMVEQHVVRIRADLWVSAMGGGTTRIQYRVPVQHPILVGQFEVTQRRPGIGYRRYGIYQVVHPGFDRLDRRVDYRTERDVGIVPTQFRPQPVDKVSGTDTACRRTAEQHVSRVVQVRQPIGFRRHSATLQGLERRHHDRVAVKLNLEIRDAGRVLAYVSGHVLRRTTQPLIGTAVVQEDLIPFRETVGRMVQKDACVVDSVRRPGAAHLGRVVIGVIAPAF